jgi:hypothetical protein
VTLRRQHHLDIGLHVEKDVDQTRTRSQASIRTSFCESAMLAAATAQHWKTTTG